MLRYLILSTGLLGLFGCTYNYELALEHHSAYKVCNQYAFPLVTPKTRKAGNFAYLGRSNWDRLYKLENGNETLVVDRRLLEDHHSDWHYYAIPAGNYRVEEVRVTKYLPQSFSVPLTPWIKKTYTYRNPRSESLRFPEITFKAKSGKHYFADHRGMRAEKMSKVRLYKTFSHYSKAGYCEEFQTERTALIQKAMIKR